MNESRTTQRTATTKRQRAQRSADALVARYVLELAGRHGRPTPVAGPGTEGGDPRPVNRTTEHEPAPFRARDRRGTLVGA